MLNSAECPPQGAKCLKCPFNKCELRAASNSQEMLKCSATQSYRYIRSFFFPPFNKVCVMPLPSVFFRGEDSTGNVLVCSTFPSSTPSWFCSNRHIVVCRSRAPLSSPPIRSMGSHRAAMAARAGLGTLRTANGTCDTHSPSPCTSSEW